ncbi:MAG: DUF2167 domain-containing protein [Gammaproteobacteria bacterium]
MRIKLFWALCLFCLFTPLSQAKEKSSAQLTPQQAKYQKWARGIWNSLDRRSGKITLPDGVATLQVPKSFYYLNPDDAQKVLVKVWGNPPGQKTQGMLFPANMTPFDRDAWAVTIDYSKDGYVSDKNADSLDYDHLLRQMQDAVKERNKKRVQQGYKPITLVGWAAKPYYDKQSHKLYWAKEIKFGKDKVDTLNYNIRVLGRKGYLVLNFIAGMDQKAMIDTKLKSVLAMASFNPGYRYSDYRPGLDKVAAYGIGGLVAGAVLSKTGMFAAALLLLKKIWILIAAGAAGVFRKFFKKKPA